NVGEAPHALLDAYPSSGNEEHVPDRAGVNPRCLSVQLQTFRSVALVSDVNTVHSVDSPLVYDRLDSQIGVQLDAASQGDDRLVGKSRPALAGNERRSSVSGRDPKLHGAKARLVSQRGTRHKLG